MSLSTSTTHRSIGSRFDHHKPMERRVKNPAQTATVAKSVARERFAELLWRAFPSQSERDLARKAAKVLAVSERQVANWLRCENDASVSVVFAVIAIAGAELVFEKMGAQP